ncbi:glycosyltransferase family 39 protein [Candidatus Woesearchaeota archaeon]|nr:glycosyltransferase family 39 protein [Candidatus Woesearchaeota archaeon]
MDVVLKHLNKNKIIYIIVFLFLITKLLMISNYKIIWWDSAVYIGMGKYIYSLGNAGFWEASRPLVWPLILGFLWKLNFDPVLFGRLVEVIFGSLCIFVTFLIGRKLFDNKVGILSSLLLAISPTFFLFNGLMLTEIVSTFFSLFGIYYLIEKKHFISGLSFGISFMTRFLQLFVFVSVILAYMFYFDRKQSKNLTKISAGFLMIVLPYFILNNFVYGSFLYPFLQQIYLTNNSGWFNYHSLSYYFIELFGESFLYILSFVGLILIFLFTNKDKNKMTVGVIFLLFFVFFNYIQQKEMRFLIISMPYMYILVAYALVYFFYKSELQSLKYVFLIIVFTSLVFSFIRIETYYDIESGKINAYKEIQEHFVKNYIKGDIWISNPLIPLYSNDKSANLMYYPTPNETNKEMLITDKSDFVFVDTCDLVCNLDDINCRNSWPKIINSLKNKMKTEFAIKNNECEQYIFRRD